MAGLATASCTGTTTSNKVDIGVKVGPVGGSTTEAGGQAQFVVTLRTQPKADVVLPVGSSDPAEGAVTPSQLVFTRDDWQTAHVVTLTGVDDDFADGHKTFEATFGAIESIDTDYAGLQLAPIPVTNLDDEDVGLVASGVSGPSTEGGAEATFQVQLLSRPTSLVQFGISSGDLTEGVLDIQSIGFTTDNWNVPQAIAVTGVDDGIPDGNQTFTINFAASSSSDPAWDGLEFGSILVVNVDDDSPGITVGAPSRPTTENGGTATFTVQLNTQPAANVLISLESDDDTEGLTNASTLTFTTANWSTPQTVTVTGQNDFAADGSVAYQVEFAPTVSTDATYANIQLTSVDLVNTDDEEAGVVVFPVNGLTTETGGTSTFEVVLAAQPASDVVVEVASSSVREGTVSPSSITFTTINWDDPVTVTVTGHNDLLSDGHAVYRVSFIPTGDATYSASGGVEAFLTNVDDGPRARVLVYDDNLVTYADDAALALEFPTTVTATEGDFLLALASNPDIVVWENTANLTLGTALEPGISAWLSSGGRLIYSDTDLDSQAGMQAVLGVNAANPYDGFRVVHAGLTIRGDLFVGQRHTFTSPLSGVNTVAGDNGSELTLAGEGVVFGTLVNSTGASAIVATTDNRVLVHGFAPDDAQGTDNDMDLLFDVQELYENELMYLLNVPGRRVRVNNNTPLPITAVTTYNSMSVVPASLDYTISKATVSLRIVHTFDADLDLFLVAPDATLVELSTDNGSFNNDYGTACAPDDARTTFDDAAATAVVDGSAPFVGSFRPEGSLGTLIGKPVDGTWTLRITDDLSGDTGTLECWSLLLEVEDPS